MHNGETDTVICCYCLCMYVNKQKNNGADGQLFYDEQVFVVILSYLNKADVSL